MRQLLRFFTAALAALSASISAFATEDAVLLREDFTGLAPGMFSTGVIGAMVEYHYLPVVAPKGGWAVSNFRSEGSQRAWRIVEQGGRRAMQHTDTAQASDRAYLHNLVVNGDTLWRDYTLAATFAPASAKGQSGIVFLYQTDRAHYFAGVDAGRAVLKRVHGGKSFRVLGETILAEAPFAWKPGQDINVRITTTGGKLRAAFDGGPVLEAQDTTFTQGKVGLSADVPATFFSVTVTCPPAAQQAFATGRAASDAEEARLQAANPQLVLWKKIATPAFGTGRNVRFGDLNGDGRTDILICQMRHHGPTDAFSEAGCLTALDLDGEILWRNGIPDRWQTVLTNDVVFQIHDVDGDGKNEVIYGRDFELVVADGATGETKYKAPMPATPRDPRGLTARYPRILGDSLAFADLRGTGARRDLILKDRYRNVWAFTDKLEPLWQTALNTGHYPFPYDVEGDGRDDLAIGYALVGPDGKTRWNNEDKIQDHADGIAVVRLKDGAEPVVLYTASDEGIVATDLQGKILKHHQVGHAQNISVADFRPDLPGLETVTINFWSNQGIVTILDSDLNILKTFEPVQHGSMILPVNWTGRPGEYWCLSTNSESGGLFDGEGRRVVKFPADGHPDYCYAVLDLTGDARDEIITWDGYEMWIYTQSDGPQPGRLYQPVRNPAYNESNYRANVSLPGWNR
jgi:rhamnogalacturonan endolyase